MAIGKEGYIPDLPESVRRKTQALGVHGLDGREARGACSRSDLGLCSGWTGHGSDKLQEIRGRRRTKDSQQYSTELRERFSKKKRHVPNVSV